MLKAVIEKYAVVIASIGALLAVALVWGPLMMDCLRTPGRIALGTCVALDIDNAIRTWALFAGAFVLIYRYLPKSSRE